MEADFTVAETERLVLRRLVATDLDAVAELFGSLEVMRYSLTGPLARSQAAEILAGMAQSYLTQPLSQWGVATKNQQHFVGLCGFLRRPDTPHGDWELAYRFLPQFWGQGLATEAAIACRDVALRTPGVTHITALIEPANVASVRVAEKTGLRLQAQTLLCGLPVLRYVLDPAEKT